MSRRSRLGLATALALVAPLVAAQAVAAPKVVASIKPLHSLVAAVMAGVGEPELIVGGASSPHVYTLRPSDAQRLADAQLVFWVGPILESFLAKPLAALAGRAEIVEFDKAAGVRVLPARAGGVWEADEDAPRDASSAAQGDGHLWLDPDNAKAIVRLAVARLSALDPGDAARYAANGTATERRLDALDGNLRRQLSTLRGVPYIVFHDAYQYLERRYGLDAIGAVAVSPENPPGARRLRELRGKIRALGARCVFSEPQFEPALVRTVAAGTGARTAVLDPLGAAIPEGPDLYFVVMRGLGAALTDCLAAPH